MSVEPLEPRQLLSATPSFTIDLHDPTGAYSAYDDQIRSTLLAAANEWAAHIDSSATIDLLVKFDASIGGALATGGASGRSDGTFRGQTVFKDDVLIKLQTGEDPNGSDPDGGITINPDDLPTTFFDPNPATRTAPIPDGDSDAYSIFLHEMAHVLGFLGSQHNPDGSVPGNSVWTFDKFVTGDGSNVFFTGPHAEAVYGKPVPLNIDSNSHLGNFAPRPGSDLLSDLMNTTLRTGTRNDISPLDLAILQDVGLPLKSTTLTPPGGGGSGPLLFNARQKATYIDPAGAVVTVALKGPGTGAVSFDDAGNAETLTLTGGSAKSALIINATRPTPIATIAANTCGSISAKAVNLTGTLAAAGLSSLTLNNVLPGARIDIAGGARSLNFTAGNLTDAAVTAAAPLGTVKLRSWTDSDATIPDTLTAPRIGVLSAAGTFQADVTTPGMVTKLTVGGALSGAVIAAGGSIGSMTVGTMIDSTVTVGGPDAGDVFANPAAQLKSFTVKSKAANAFTGSRITAPAIASAKLGRVAVANAGGTFGVTTRRLKAIAAITPAQPKFSQRSVVLAGGAYNEMDFEVRLLA